MNVSDVAHANLQAARAREVTGAFNIGSGTRVSINDVVRRMERAFERPSTVQYRPPRDGDVRDSMADITSRGGFWRSTASSGHRSGGVRAWARQEL